ncbi:MAG: hypothetical protein NXI00_24100, partial [Cytophagales bacterium]|nr:hypothetical protein [Cytophagales bacterium]
FGEEFSVSYPKSDTSIDELIMDFYSRLHDYSADSAKDLIIRLKILQLENRFAEQINALREIVLTRQKSLRPEEVLFDFSDIIPSEKDINGFPKFGLFISIKGEQILMKEIGINEFSHKLGEELESKVFEKLMD